MATSVTITGSGTPVLRADRAGAGVLVRHRDVALQFDAGRATTMRLAGAQQPLTELDALFVTHHHSDHMVGIADLIMTRWLDDIEFAGQAPLPVYAPDGDAVGILEHVLDAWQDEITLRQQHSGRPNRPQIDVRAFTATKDAPVPVATFGDVAVFAVAVDHEPVVPAVGYRIVTSDGAAVVSGDTAVCRQIETISRAADVLVHEAMRGTGLEDVLSDPVRLLAYHAETVALGAMAARARVGHLVLTHLIPPPDTEEQQQAFVADVRRGGYQGPVTVADDLATVEF